jgi:uncharacterized protein with GYD domain
MSTYVTLINWTQQGIENVKEGPARLDAAKEVIEASGGKYIGYYLTLGQYDGILISEYSDDKTLGKLALAFGAQGNVRTQTLKAFTEEEFRQMIAELP